MRFKCDRSFNAFLLFSIALGICGSITHAILGQSWVSSSGHAIGSDDAYISFRYAENLFAGNGLVFNFGEYVEGYSNLLYTLLITPGFLLGKDYIYPLSIGINCILLAASLYLYWKFSRETIGLRSANLGVFLLAANPWIWANASTGLETILILFVTLGLWVSTERYKEMGSMGFFIAILSFSIISVLSRVDGFIPPLISALYLFIRKSKKDGILVIIFVAGCMALYTVFRFFYYDDFIANTFYVKVSGGLTDRFSRGLDFLGQNLIKTGLIIAALALYFHFLRNDPSQSTLERTSFAALFLVYWVSYLVYIGGDIYYERFIVPIIPFIVYIALSNGDRFKKLHLYIVTVLIYFAPIYYASKDGRFEWSSPKYDMWVSLGKYLGEAPKGSTLAIDAAGKVPFFSGLPTIDILGLNDKHIGKIRPTRTGMPGHEKFDPDYVLGRAPTYISAWISPSLDMGWGLVKEKYIKEYKLKYLVNSSRKDLDERNIIDVSSLGVLELKNLIQNGYNYGVLLRKENFDDHGQL